MWQGRSSRFQKFFIIGVLKNFAIFTRKKRLFTSLRFSENFTKISEELHSQDPKKRLIHRCFPVNITNFLSTAPTHAYLHP